MFHPAIPYGRTWSKFNLLHVLLIGEHGVHGENIGEHGVHGEHGEHGKDGKHQPVFMIENTLCVTQNTLIN